MSDRVGDRYCVRAVLGQGGMARVYRAYDELAGRDVALKHWWAGANKPVDQAAHTQSISQFEYEYRTLAQLRHPSVIEVYDYGLTERGPYFTMELLDGGDLRERAPLPWAAACQVLYDVCSSLALLHSRRLIHRDVSPRNVRCTRDGAAKLIDFGAMRRMGSCRQIVGTPAFAAPEVVQGLPLDGRVDLFSLGATLYFALTGRQPSAARDFSEVLPLAQHKPLLPSQIVPEIPAALDSLVLALLDPDPALRPRSAFEVMQRLAAIARIESGESRSVAQAYLATPDLVGREAALTRVRERCTQAVAGQGGTLVLAGAQGMGRTRMLDVCALWGKTLGAHVLRCRGARTDAFACSVSRELAEQLNEVLPLSALRTLRERSSDFDALFEPEPPQEDTAVLVQSRGPLRLRSSLHASGLTTRRIHTAIVDSVLAASELGPLVVTIDDVDAVAESSVSANDAMSPLPGYDPESLALLAELAAAAPRHHLLLLFSQSSPAAVGGDSVQLAPLSLEQTSALFRSVFGDVPNLALLSDRVHTIAAGNPGQSIDLASWLVDRRMVRYEAGSWTLPNELTLADLPSGMTATWHARLSGLSPLARTLAALHTHSLHDGFGLRSYRALLGQHTTPQLAAAIADLVEQHLLGLDNSIYKVTQPAWCKVLRESLTVAETQSAHEALAQYYLRNAQPSLHFVHHLLCAGRVDSALEHVIEILQTRGERLDFEFFSAVDSSPEQAASILARCLEATRSANIPLRHELLLRRWLTVLSVLTSDQYYFEAAPAWRIVLERATGLSALRADQSAATPAERLQRALRNIERVHADTPPEQQAYAPAEALEQLLNYVGCSLAIAARRLDTELLNSLPCLLEPFAQLRPEIHAMWQLALGAQQNVCRGQVEQARARWLEVYRSLDDLTDASLHLRTFIRGAVAYAIGASEASLGMQSALRWASELDRDPLQAVSAMYLRRIARLQLGDFEGAEHFRRKAEWLAVRPVAAQMFTSTIVLELVVHAIGGDLLGIRQLADRIAPLADACPTWQPYRALARGYFERVRGDASAAASAFRECLELCAPVQARDLTYAWPLATAGLAETLIDLGDYVEAARIARAGLTRCRKHGVLGLSRMLVRALALAEAKRGQHAYAAELLDATIETARNRAISGVQLGCMYEARAFVAIEAGETQLVAHYARMAAREYRYGYGSTLGARCERLFEAAALRDPRLPQPWAAWAAALHAHGKLDHAISLEAEVSRAMSGAARAEGRSLRALRLLCENQGASAGHLLLVTDAGLRVAASYGVDPPDPALLAHAEQRMQSDLRQREDVTRVRGDTNTRFELETRACWTDPQGRAFEARVLHCVQDGKPRCAGIALLLAPATSSSGLAFPHYASVLSAYLIRCGETSGL